MPSFTFTSSFRIRKAPDPRPPLSAAHAGPSTMMAILADSYHLLGARRLVKSLSQHCVKCQRAYCRTSSQLIGPFSTKRGSPRRSVKLKSYVCVFACFCTRSVHFELCSEQTTSSMLASLTRFVARSGLPGKIFTDNGTNFIGAAKEIDQCFKLLSSSELQDELAMSLNADQLEWHFSPARAPHFGRLWEAGVKAMKSTLLKILPPHPLSFEEFCTVLTDAGAAVNSRPLTPVDSHPPDRGTILTPGHFLIGRPLKALPTQTDSQVTVSLQRRWKLTRQLSQEIWHLWKSTYLKPINAHSKWKTARPNLQVGDVVVVKDETLRQRTWPLALVIRTFPGKGELVRVVDIRCQNKVFR